VPFWPADFFFSIRSMEGDNNNEKKAIKI
jgi:hypothetical protein